MFNFIKNLISKIFTPVEKEEKIPAYMNPYPYNGDPENGDAILSIMFTLTDEGVLLIDMENSTRKFEPIELASLISYIGSFRGQMDTLDIIKEGMIDGGREEDHEKFLGHYVSLKTQEAESLEGMSELDPEDDDTPCIDPSEMMP